jgi:dynamin 1-like protein
MKAKLTQMLTQTTEEMKSYGNPQYDISKGALLLQMINAFSSGYTEMIEGKVTDEKCVDTLYGGARINFIFNDIFAKYLNSLSAIDDLTPFDIRTAIGNATVRICIFSWLMYSGTQSSFICT